MKFKKVIVLGSGTIAVECITCLATYRNDVIVIEQEEQSISLLRTISQKYGLEYKRMTDKQDLMHCLEVIEEETLVISANNNYIFPSRVLKKKNFVIINFHNALLPNYPGRNAPTWVIFNEEKTTGTTWHMVSDRIDAGDILIQKSIEVSPLVTALELTKQCMDAGAQGFRQIIAGILEGRFSCCMQDMEYGDHFHYLKDIPNRGYLDLSWTTNKVSAFLRCLNYGKVQLFPVPKVVLLGQPYLIQHYSILVAEPPGYQMNFREDEMILQDDERIIRLVLQRA